jgi:hypothetical protein
MPTPRPETEVTFSAVEKPAAKMRAKVSSRERTAPAAMTPFSTAFL